MKHLLRKYEALASEREAESYGFYEAKHTRVFPCAEGTLHERCSLHFSYTEGVLHCRAPKFIQEIIKNALHKQSIVCIRQSRNYLFVNCEGGGEAVKTLRGRVFSPNDRAWLCQPMFETG